MFKIFSRLATATLIVILGSSIIWAAAPSEIEREFDALEAGQYVTTAEFQRRLQSLYNTIDVADNALLMRWKRLHCWSLEPNDVQTPPKLIAVATNYIAEAEAANDLAAIADFHLCRGYYEQVYGDVDLALQDYNLAIELVTNSEHEQLIADAYSSRGDLYAYQGELALGLGDLLVAQKYYESADITYWIRQNMASIANTYRRIGNFDRALEYYQQLERIFLEEDKVSALLEIREQIALVLEDQGQYQQAYTLYSDALDYYLAQSDDYGVAFSRLNIAGVMLALEKPTQALKHLSLSEAIFDEHPDFGTSALVHLFIGRAHYQLGDNQKALDYFDLAEPSIRKEKNFRYLAWLLQAKAKALSAEKRWQEAYETTEEYQRNHEQLDLMLRKQQTVRMQVEFDVARKEAENERLKADTLIKQKQVESLEERRRWQLIVLFLGGILLLVALVFLIRQVNSKRQLHRLASTDELTGLPNRRDILQRGKEMIDHARAEHAPFSVLVFDIDFFKRINDTYGHHGGDEVLRLIAPASLSVMRYQDRVGRTGGEEFLALLPGAGLDHAAKVAERLRQKISDIDTSTIAVDMKVSVSIGVAQLTADDSNLSELIQRADNALYRAKENGRDCVEIER
ncbi:GGDEF domain-containing protein [Corallincola luteus]|uniref:diguanylate cyclase n=1 Tax=Corallincola luteus TaxID=1775177 RepID=A0ABY2AKV1_9GAMM|nr:GGDEF domain-containing protein [Corallincola luteus]TCI03269.1 GGDEF domain-containing protein [Corallincola luteus]